MARRVGLPEHIKVDLNARASAGCGHDADYPTNTDEGVVPARQACLMPPSAEMTRKTQEIVDFLNENGAQHVTVEVDLRRRGEPGTLTVLWAEGASPAAVAEKFAVSTSDDDGTPLLPVWLNLRRDKEFDMRWQPAY